MHARYPARFQLILAANPCPCGQAATPGAHCHCSPMVVRLYAEKISGPIRDRIDINQAFLPLRKAYLREESPIPPNSENQSIDAILKDDLQRLSQHVNELQIACALVCVTRDEGSE